MVSHIAETSQVAHTELHKDNISPVARNPEFSNTTDDLALPTVPISDSLPPHPGLPETGPGFARPEFATRPENLALL